MSLGECQAALAAAQKEVSARRRLWFRGGSQVLRASTCNPARLCRRILALVAEGPQGWVFLVALDLFHHLVVAVNDQAAAPGVAAAASTATDRAAAQKPGDPPHPPARNDELPGAPQRAGVDQAPR